MSNKIANVASDLLEQMEQPSTPVEKIDPLDDLKTNIFTFFSGRMASITKQDNLLQLIQGRLELLLENDPELPLTEVLAIYRLISTKIAESSDSLIGLFRPTPGAGSPLAEAMTRQPIPKDPVAKFFNSMSPKDLEKLEKSSTR